MTTVEKQWKKLCAFTLWEVAADDATVSCSAVFSGLYERGLFLPPLLLIDLVATKINGEQPGLSADTRPKLKAQQSFLRYFRNAFGFDKAHRDRNVPQSFDAIISIARRVMAEVVDADTLLQHAADQCFLLAAEQELIFLTSPKSTSLVAKYWDVLLEGMEAGGMYASLLPTRAQLAGRSDHAPNHPIDPFIPPLLFGEKPPRLIPECSPPGSQYGGHEKEPSLSSFGEFEKRELSRLPENLNRLAPNELGLLTNPDYFVMFIHKAQEGGLNQSFFKDYTSSRLVPKILLDVELSADPTGLSYRNRAGLYPLSSWYRAVGIWILWQFGQMASAQEWSFDMRVGTTEDHWSITPCFESAKDGNLFQFVRNIARYCPGWVASVPLSHNGEGKGLYEKPDLHLRIVLGSAEQSHSRKMVLPRSEKGARVEQLLNGSWGIGICDRSEFASIVDLQNFSANIEKPQSIASQILELLLGSEKKGSSGASSTDFEVELA